MTTSSPLGEGVVTVPKGTDHLPYADNEAHVLLFELRQAFNTGNAVAEKQYYVNKPGKWPIGTYSNH